MSRREIECEGKKAYQDKASAEAFIRNNRARLRPSIRAYQCRWCERWHIGHAGSGTNGRSARQRGRSARR